MGGGDVGSHGTKAADLLPALRLEIPELTDIYDLDGLRKLLNIASSFTYQQIGDKHSSNLSTEVVV